MAETEQEGRARYLVETYADQLLRLGYTLLGSVPDAQDVCQEVLLKALDRTQPFESRAHEKAWLLRVTVNACKNLRRSPWRTRTVSLEAVGEPAAFQPRAGGLLEEVLALPEAYRAVIVLYYYFGYDTNEIGALLDLRPEAVRTRLRRARQRLKTELEGTDYEGSLG